MHFSKAGWGGWLWLRPILFSVQTPFLPTRILKTYLTQFLTFIQDGLPLLFQILKRLLNISDRFIIHLVLLLIKQISIIIYILHLLRRLQSIILDSIFVQTKSGIVGMLPLPLELLHHLQGIHLFVVIRCFPGYVICRSSVKVAECMLETKFSRLWYHGSWNLITTGVIGIKSCRELLCLTRTLIEESILHMSYRSRAHKVGHTLIHKLLKIVCTDSF